ncbi:PAS domain-containing sensor histidine kinase [Roseivivax sp. CAU 1753]
MNPEPMKKILSNNRVQLVALLVIACLLGAFGFLTVNELSPDHAHMSLDVYLVTMAILIVAGGAFFQLHVFNRQQSRILAMQLRENTAMRAALDTHAIVTVTDASGTIIDVNERFVETYGYSRDESIGQTPHFMHDGKDGQNFFHQIRSGLARGESWSGEHSAITKTGERRWFKATIVPMTDKKGRLLKAISIRTDVTALRAAAVDSQVRGLLDNLQDEVYIYRISDLQIRYMNNSACARLGWDQADCTNRTILDTKQSMKAAEAHAHLEPLLRGEVAATYVQTTDPDRPTEIATSLFEQDNGEFVFISVVRDITERQALARAKLSSVSVVSHELRTPLTSIAGALKMLQGRFEADLSPQASGILDIAARNTDRLLFIVNDILDLEKIEAGKMSFDVQEVDLEALVSDAVVSHQTFASGRNVRLAYEAECRDATVHGDPARLMQVMSNLLSNAAKYSGEGDVVTVNISDRGAVWRVAVRDRGPGISDEGKKKLFETFAQLTAADGVKRVGTGLGLAITKRILDRHGASIDVDSRVGSGATFFFDIPKAERRDDEAAA